MANPTPLDLGRRERQIMEAVYARGEASVSDVLAALPAPPGYSAVRAMLNTLAEKGHLSRKKAGKKFLYLPAVAREKVRRSALRRMLDTFFGGSALEVVASLIEMDRETLSSKDLKRLSRMIDEARKEGR